MSARTRPLEIREAFIECRPGRLRLMLGRIGALWVAMENRRAAARYFAGANTRTLSDIGLTAGDVDAAFSGPLWRDPTEHLARVKRAAAPASPRQ